MNIFSKEIDKRKRLEQLMDVLSLGAVLQYCVYRFLQSTMFNLYYSQTYKLFTLGLLIVFGGLRYLYNIIKKWKKKGSKEKIKFVLKCGFTWFLSLPFFYVGWLHDYKILIFLPICCMCLYDIDSEKIFRSFVIVIGIMLVSTVICCLSDTVRNLTLRYAAGLEKAAYGIINTTDFASYGTFLLLGAWCGMRNRHWICEVLFVILSIAVSYLLYMCTGSLTVIYSACLLGIFIIWDYLYAESLKNKKGLNHIIRRLTYLSTIAFPIFGILVLVLTMLYSRQLPWAIQIDNLLSGRLNATLTPFKTYGIKPFGTIIASSHGYGATIITTGWITNGYGYIDVAYAMLAIKYGWVITGIVTGVWIWFTSRAIRAGKIRCALAMVVLAAHGLSEARILDVNYNIFLVMPFCAFTSLPKIEKSQEEVAWFPIVSSVILVGGAYVFLPKLLSIFRTFFYLNGWNEGIAGGKSLLFTVIMVFCVWIVWKLVNILWHNWKKKQNRVIIATATVSIITLVTICMFMVNNRINNGIIERSDRLKAEETTIRKVQELADLPVYASEFYQRSIGGFSEHLFSSEQLYYQPRGTLVTAPIVEAPGWYLQISDQTAIYSFDQAVIDGLTAEGFIWSWHNNSEHIINLSDTAVFNGRRPDQELVLNSGEEIRTKNYQVDQVAGIYEICVGLSLLSEQQYGTICRIEVLGEAGDRVIMSEAISFDDFDEYGKCKYTAKYQIPDTPMVMYGILAEDGTCIVIDEMVWRRII